jgi:hypothetical protein
MEKENQAIAIKILSFIPPNIKPVNYLMDLFGLSSESIYRRIRGDIPFTLEEVTRLSHELDFSIDELVAADTRKISFDLLADSSTGMEGMFLSVFEQFDDHIQTLLQAENTSAIMSWSYIPPIFLVDFNHIFRFYYYKWLHQGGEIPSGSLFSQIVIPDKILSLKNRISSRLRKTKNNILIIGPNLFFNTIKEVEYYYRRKLITSQERELLKEDILGIIDFMETLVHGGELESGSGISFYLSSLDIKSNNSYVEYDNGQVAYFWVYSVPPIAIHNKEACAMQKKWLESIKKYSSLITQSNEMAQGEFFRIQREYVNDMDNLSLIHAEMG